MTKTDIAKVLTQMNKTFYASLENINKPNWNECTEKEKDYVLNYVSSIIYGEYKNAEDFHNSWVKEMVKDGWSYSDVTDLKTKKSNDILHFDNLQINNQLIYNLLFDTTISLKPFLKDIQ